MVVFGIVEVLVVAFDCVGRRIEEVRIEKVRIDLVGFVQSMDFETAEVVEVVEIEWKALEAEMGETAEEVEVAGIVLEEDLDLWMVVTDLDWEFDLS